MRWLRRATRQRERTPFDYSPVVLGVARVDRTVFVGNIITGDLDTFTYDDEEQAEMVATTLVLGGASQL